MRMITDACQLTYWNCIDAAVASAVALHECRHRHHVSVAGEVRILGGEIVFLQCKHGEVSLRVAEVVDLNVGAGDALEVEINFRGLKGSQRNLITFVGSILNDGIDDRRSIGRHLPYHLVR